MEFQSPLGGPLDLTLTLPPAAPSTGLLHLTYPHITLPAGAYGRMVWREGDVNTYQFEIDEDHDGITDQTLTPLASSLTPLSIPPPQMLTVNQWMKGASPTMASIFRS